MCVGRPCGPPVMALRISRAASSRISMDACSLYQAVCGVQIRLGASFRGPWLKLQTVHPVRMRAEGARPCPKHTTLHQPSGLPVHSDLPRAPDNGRRGLAAGNAALAALAALQAG